MLEYNRIDVSKRIDTNKTHGSRESIIIGTFSGKMLDFTQKYMMAVNNMTQNVAVKGHDYRIYFWFMTKTEAADRTKNVDLSEKSRQLRL